MAREIIIGNRKIGDGHPAYVVAEIGINHNGDLEIAKKLMRAAKDAGVNAVKFQKRTPEICVPLKQQGQMRETPWGYITYLEYRHKVELTREDYLEIDRYARELGIDWFASPGMSLRSIFSRNLILSAIRYRRRQLQTMGCCASCVTPVDL